MLFIILTFIAAFFIEGLGSLVSVIGISALFGSNPIIIALAVALDVGKVVVVSLLYTYWAQLSKAMKAYALIAATVTMTITSAGAFGYLSGEFQKAMLGTKEGELKVGVFKEQQAKFQERKKQIDDQIASLPTKTPVNQRLRLMNGFKAEQQALDEKIAAIDKQLPDLQIAQIGIEAKAGPILYISKAFNVSVEEAVKWVILMIIIVFDPLAVFLIIAGNFLVQQRKAKLLPPNKLVLDVVPPPNAAPQKASDLYDDEVVAADEVSMPVIPPEPQHYVPYSLGVAEVPSIDPAPTDEPEVEVSVAEQVPEVEKKIYDDLLPHIVDIAPQPAREEITRSTLGLDKPEPAFSVRVKSSFDDVKADPDTIVDAGTGGSIARSLITTPTRKT